MSRLDLLFRRLGELATMAKEIAAESVQCEEAIVIERAIMASKKTAVVYDTASKEEVPSVEMVKETLEANR